MSPEYTAQLLTRADAGVGEGLFDSVAWAFEVHVQEPDRPGVLAAVIYGTEDAPERIDFYAEAEPLETSEPVLTWWPEVAE